MFNILPNGSTVHFKRWTRKSYAVFNSLNKQIKIAVLSVAIVNTWGGMDANAQKTDTANVSILYLDELEIEVDRLNALEELGEISAIISTQQLKQSSAQSLSSLLDFVPSMDVRQRGAGDIQSDISIRGGTFDQNMILLNGFNISNPQTGHNTLNLPIELSWIDKVELKEGSGAKLLGYNAFSGAANLITGMQKTPLTLEVSAGDFGYLKASVKSFFQLAQKTDHHVGVAYAQSSGHQSNTDYQLGRFFYHGKWHSLRSQLEWMFGYADKAFGANSFYTAKYPNQFEETSSQLGAVKFSNVRKHFKITGSLLFQRSNDRFELFRNKPAVWYQHHNHHQTDVYAVNASVTNFNAFGVSTLFMELRNERVKSNVLGLPMLNVMEDRNLLYVPTRHGQYDHQYSRTIKAITLAHKYVYKNISFKGTYMLLASPKLNGYPGIDVGWEPVRGHKLNFSVDRSMRLPTFTDLFYHGPSQESNVDLKPEEAISYTFNYGLTKQHFSLTGSLFYREGSNLIDWAKKEGEDIWKSMNIAHLNTMGASVQYNLNFSFEKQSTRENYFNVGYSFMDKRNPDKGFQSSYAFDYLSHKITTQLGVHFFTNFEWVIGGYYQIREGAFDLYENGIRIGPTSYKPFLVLDMSVRYRVKRVTFFSDITNVFNEQYYDYGNVLLPGRWFKVGARYQIPSR